MLYDKAYSSESRLVCIEEAEVHYDVAFGRNGIKLFVSAVPAAHAGSHYY